MATYSSSPSRSYIDNLLVKLSLSLTRGVTYSVVNDQVNTIINYSPSILERDYIIEDLIVLAFQTRDIRHGKGERLASEHLFKSLLVNEHSKSIMMKSLELIPVYGCWRDLFSLGIFYCGMRLVDIVEAQFLKDEVALATGKPISLLAKWMPREGHLDVFPFVVRLVPGSMFQPTRMKLYRKRLAHLNKAIDTVEIKMCANQWDLIDPNKVPANAMHKYEKAFLNMNLPRVNTNKPLSGLRYPNLLVRSICHMNFADYFNNTFIGEVADKSDIIFPHELVKKAVELIGGPVFNPEDIPYDEIHHIEGVWKTMVEITRLGGGLGRSLAMCDFSESMEHSKKNGSTPYWVSLALGLLISEVTTEEFKDTILTFDSKPKFHQFPGGGLFNKLKTLSKDNGHGLNTDFRAAMDIVLKVLKDAKAKPGDEPENLIVLTNMNWYNASASESPYVREDEWNARIETIRESFKRAGEDMWGVGNGLNMPRIVIWNLDAEPSHTYAIPETDGVVMLSGWSPNIFKVIQRDSIVVKTPVDVLSMQIDSERYSPIRSLVKDHIRATAYDLSM
jgi:hypothetical protein